MIFTYQTNIIRKYPKNIFFNCSNRVWFPLSAKLEFNPNHYFITCIQPDARRFPNKKYITTIQMTLTLFFRVLIQSCTLWLAYYTHLYRPYFVHATMNFVFLLLMCAVILFSFYFYFFASCCLLLVSPTWYRL